MKIIRRRTIPETPPVKVTCPHCESELEYGTEDIRRNDEAYHITCPVCVNTIIVPQPLQP